MGMNWKTNAKDFEKYFEYEPQSFSMGFYISDFSLGNVEVKTITFVFENPNSNEEIEFTEENYTKFLFEKVLIDFEPDQFAELLQIFTKKYRDSL